MRRANSADDIPVSSRSDLRSVIPDRLPHRQLSGQANVAYCSIGAVHRLWQSASMAEKHFIREWREHRDLSQLQLAEAIGRDKSYVSKIENGKKRYDQPFLEAVSEVLQVHPSTLLLRKPSPNEGPDVMFLFAKLTDDVQRKSLETIVNLRAG